MKASTSKYIAAGMLGMATGALSCNDTDAVSGSGSAVFGIGAVAGGPISAGTGGSSTETPPLLEAPSHGTLPEMPHGGGAAGMAGEGGAGGESDAPPVPMPPDGALLSGIWDDNLNFTWFEQLVETGGDAGQLSFEKGQHLAASERASERAKAHQTLDVALLVDTTGSMADELSYLQETLGALWQSIDLAYPHATQRWAVVAYRDEGDNYVSRPFDFMAKQQELQSVLSAQRAEGGGDQPEASHQALLDMLSLDWRREDSNARLAFWVTDAPHRPEKAAVVEQALLTAQADDIRIYPVASTNVDSSTARALRVAAQITGGRYLFLVDSGARADTTTAITPPCFYVTELGAALLRIITIEMDGTYQPPSATHLLASRGAPISGQCQLDTGSALAY